MPQPVDAPAPFDHRRLLFGSPSPLRVQPALVAAVGLGAPATLAYVAGDAAHATLVSLGAFTALYAVDRPYRYRAGLLGGVAALLVLSVGFGAAVGLAAGHLGPSGSGWGAAVVVAGVTGMAALATFLANALVLGPPGGFFFALSAGMSAQLVGHGIPLGTILGLALLGAACAWLASMAPSLWAPHGPVASRLRVADAAVRAHLRARDEGRDTSRTRTDAALALHGAWGAIAEAGIRDSATSRALHALHVDFASSLGQQATAPASPEPREDRDLAEDIPLGMPTRAYLLRRALHVDTAPTLLALRVVVACALAGALTMLLGTDRPDWAIASAILVLHSGVDRVLGTHRALHRLVGTLAGLLLFAAMYTAEPTGLLLLALLALLQLVIELVVVRHYAVAVVFITALVLLVTSRPGLAVGHVMQARLVDTVIGVGVGIVVLWTVGRRFWREGLPRQLRRVDAAVSALQEQLRRSGPSADASMEARRDLQVELIEAARVADTAHRNAPRAAAEHWERHLRLQHEGYALLASCWTTR